MQALIHPSSLQR